MTYMNLLEDLNNPLWKSKNIIYCYTNKINNKKIYRTSKQKENWNIKNKTHTTCL